MSLSRDSLKERQWKMIRRAQYRLTQGLARLQWEEDVLIPEIEAMKANKALPQFGLSADKAIEIVVEDANHHQSPAEDISENA